MKNIRILNSLSNSLLYSRGRWSWFLCPLPFSLGMFAYAELRKLHARCHPDGWIAREMLFWVYNGPEPRLKMAATGRDNEEYERVAYDRSNEWHMSRCRTYQYSIECHVGDKESNSQQCFVLKWLLRQLYSTLVSSWVVMGREVKIPPDPMKLYIFIEQGIIIKHQRKQVWFFKLISHSLCWYTSNECDCHIVFLRSTPRGIFGGYFGFETLLYFKSIYKIGNVRNGLFW